MLRTRYVALLLTVCLAGDAIGQTPTWDLELLGTPPPEWSGVYAIAVNDSGVAVGNTYISGYRRAWIVGPDLRLQLLPFPAGMIYSQVEDLNSSGVAVGSVWPSGGGSYGILWRPAAGGYEYVLLPGIGATQPFDARAINDLGDVVGKFGILGGSYHWSEASGTTQISTAMFPVVPAAINNARQIVGDSYRMDLDTFVLEDIGNPVGTSYNYVYTRFGSINDAGQCAGYAVVATSQPPYIGVRYTDGPSWKLFNSFPWYSGGAGGLASSGDTVYVFGSSPSYFVYVDGYGSIGLQSTLAPAYAGWDLTGSFSPGISRGSKLVCTGSNATTGQGGVVLLTPSGFDDLGGGAAGALGEPVLSGYGYAAPAQTVRMRLASAAPNQAGYFLVSTVSKPVPFKGGTLYANPSGRFGDPRGDTGRGDRLLVTDDLGRAELGFAWPSLPPGSTLYLQAVVTDPAAAFQVSLSNALAGVTQ